MRHRQPTGRSPCTLSRHFVLGAVVALFAGTGTVGAQNKTSDPPPKDEPPGNQILAEIQPLHLAVLTVGASAQPQLGSCEAVTFLRLGEHPQYRTWTIEDPLSSPRNRALVGAST